LIAHLRREQRFFHKARELGFGDTESNNFLRRNKEMSQNTPTGGSTTGNRATGGAGTGDTDAGTTRASSAGTTGGTGVGGGYGAGSGSSGGGQGLSTTTGGGQSGAGQSAGGGAGAGTATGLAATAQEYGKKVAGAATTAKDYVADKMSVVGDKIKDLQNTDVKEVANQAKDYARQNPGQAILISAAAGLVLGLLIRSSRR
jgi:ElaB/YqjD/DUF883 family membrane-anchored ribosome-binding protein